ncbi:hypothetical protein Tco_0978816 [Tanacetum coccineum]|uniref:Reverse transcriptase domain-containing protein n=1 Tax=Tanacetum coccineum TaxID=301880 RepID=A0ABQ5EPC0_9ASTR
MDTVKCKAPPPMSGLAENWNKNKYYEFYRDKGHNTDECIHLKKQIKEAVKYEQLSHLIKELKQGNRKGEHSKASKKGEPYRKEKALAIFMVQPWQRVTRQKITQSFSTNPKISFPPLANDDGRDSNRVVTLHSSNIVPAECMMVAESPAKPLPKEPMTEKGIKVAIHPKYPKHTITIGGGLSKKER